MNNQYVTKDELTEAMKAQTDEIVSVLHDFMNQVSARFDAQDARFDAQDARFDAQDARFDRIDRDVADMRQQVVDLKASFDRLMNTIDHFVGRIDTYETEMAVRDRQMERLLEWAQKVSAKTGIPLENL